MGAPAGNTSYGYITGSIFIFNLIVGTGALALPYGWNEAGLINGVFFTLVVFFFAYMCATFVMEAMARATAIMENPEGGPALDVAENIQAQEIVPLVVTPNEYRYFEDEKGQTLFYPNRVEMGTMSEVFLGKWGRLFFYIVLLVYLYGDLCIYAVAVPQSVLVTLTPNGMDFWGYFTIPGYVCYWYYLFVYAVVVVPLSFFSFTNTKYLQMFTVVCRNLAFLMMIGGAFYYIGIGEGSDPSEVPLFIGKGIPSLWGTIIYCFMCHHSIPGLLSPLKQKRRVNTLFLAVYVLLLLFYTLLSLSGMFAFSTQPADANCSEQLCPIQSLYTYNFLSFPSQLIAYLLGLYPLFTITSNYPLIAITLRNNMLHIVPWGKEGRWAKYRVYIFSALASIPSFVVASVFTDVDTLVSLTGSYAGLFIEFVIPSILVYYARKESSRRFPGEENPYSSPFKNVIWIWTVNIVAGISLVIVTFNNVLAITEFFTGPISL